MWNLCWRFELKFFYLFVFFLSTSLDHLNNLLADKIKLRDVKNSFYLKDHKFIIKKA